MSLDSPRVTRLGALGIVCLNKGSVEIARDSVEKAITRQPFIQLACVLGSLLDTILIFRLH